MVAVWGQEYSALAEEGRCGYGGVAQNTGGEKASRFSPCDPFREAGPRTDNALFTPARIAAFRCAATARRGAFADERRIVGGKDADLAPSYAISAAALTAPVDSFE